MRLLKLLDGWYEPSMCRHPPVRPHFAAVAGGRQMGSARIQLNSNTCIALSCCLSSFLPSFALRIKALAPYSRALLLYSALRLLLHVLYQHLSFSLYDGSQILKTVFFQSSIVLCILFRGITSSFRRSTSKMEGWSCYILVILSRVRGG